MQRTLTITDIERLFDARANAIVETAIETARAKRAEVNAAGLLRSSNFPLMVEEATYKILRDGVSICMQLYADVMAKTDMPLDTYRAPVESSVTNIAYRLFALVQEAEGLSGFQVLDQMKVRVKYETAVTHALADLEVGMIDGKPVKASPQSVTVNVAGDNAGNIQIAGHGSQQHIALTSITMQVDLAGLAGELEQIRPVLVQDMKDAPQAIAVGQVAQAEEAAKSGDKDGAMKSLASLSKGGGKWVFDMAGKVGAPILTELLKRHLGL